MARLLAGVSRLSLLVAMAALAAPAPGIAADVVVPAGTTDTTGKTLIDGDRLIVQDTGALSVNGTAVSSTVTTPNGISIENAGIVESTASGGRAVNIAGSNNNLRLITIVNAPTGTIRSADDAIRVNADLGTGSVVTITNSGLILSSADGQALDLAAIASGRATITITNTATGVIRAVGNDAIRPGSGNITIANDGLIDATASASRAINTNIDLTKLYTFTLTNGATGIIQSQDDAVRINGSGVTGASTTVQVSIDNAGVIRSTGAGSAAGQAIDLDNITSSAARVTIVNRETGVITASNADAIRPGQNFTLTNYGRIIALSEPVPTDRPSSDGIDLQDNHTGTIYNYGLISGAKAGINVGTGSTVTVYNYADGTIVGQDGSGVGSDNIATVYNWGTITGTIDTTSARGDGDGIDVDGVATIVNYGLIQGLGAKGWDDGGRLNNSEGIAIGGGSVTNYGTISGAGAGIVVNNDSTLSRSGTAATTIVNAAGATIVGRSSYAIRLENKTGTSADDDTIVNAGTIIGNGVIPDAGATIYLQSGAVDGNSVGTLDGVVYTGTGSARFIRGDGSAIQMGEGADRLVNSGVIVGNTGRAVNMEGGDDTVSVMPGSRIVGLVNGGAGTDTLDYQKVGLSDAKKAALLAGETVNIGGTLYTSFEAFTGVSRSFSSYATSAATSGVAWTLDNGATTTSASLATQALIDRVATATDVAGALAQLTPGALQALATIGLDTALQATETIGQRLTRWRDGGSGLEVRGLDQIASLLEGSRAVAGLEAPGSAAAGLDPRLAGVSTAFAAAEPPRRGHDAFAALDPTVAQAGMSVKAVPGAIESPWGGFVQGSAATVRRGATTTSPQTRYRSAGVTAGIDYRVTPEAILGGFVGYGRTTADLDAFGSSGTVSTWLGGVYGGWRQAGWFAQGTALYGRSDNDSSRVALGTVNTGGSSGDLFAVQGVVGKDLRLGRMLVSPELGLQYTRVTVGGFTERGDAALAVGESRLDSLRSTLGVRGRTVLHTGLGAVTPEWRAFWQHEYLDETWTLGASFLDASFALPFATTVGAPGRDFALLGVGLTAGATDRLRASIDYDVKLGADDFVAHVISGRLRAAF
ncbi:autotransporter domain-containing protein [Rhodoplanes azumiensis]|uniref:Autotransporter domain-containing protein n=1 Tax=Rhodoplanes azumiensis TaxID=1897628 RepID=A0ABW5AIZ1_9BRAD